MILVALPALTLLLASLVAVLPLGAGDGVRMCVSFAPLVVTHYWCARRPRLLPVSLVFGAGLAIDILAQGPLGFWSLMMLAAGALGRLEEALTGHSTLAGRAAVYCIAMLCLAGIAWVVTSLFNGVTVDGQPLLIAALVSILAYPIVAMALMPIDRLWESPRPYLFTRGA